MEGIENIERKSMKMLGILVLIFVVLVALLLILIYPSWLKDLGKFKKFFLGSVDVSVSVSVGNVLAEASSASLNGGDAITLTENTTTSITATGTVTDNNSCKDLASVSIAVYKDGTTCAVIGDADNDNCYFYTDSDPTNDASCTGDDDVTYAASHAFNIQYYADGGTWETTITPTDIVEAGTPDTSTGVTLNDLQALDVGSITYGSVNPGASSVGDNTADVSNTGNTAVDFKVSGTDLTCDGRGNIPVANEQYGLAGFSYGDGTALSGTPADVNADLPAPSVATVPVQDTSYWQVSVPNGTKGTCSGTTSFAVQAAL